MIMIILPIVMIRQKKLMITYNDTTNNCNDHTKWNDNYEGQNCYRIIVMTNYCVRIIIVSFFMRVKEYGKLAQNTTIVKIKKNDWHAPDDKSFFYHYISQSLKIWSLNVINYNMLIPIQICTAYQATELWRPVQSRFEVRGGTDNCSEHGEHQTWFVVFSYICWLFDFFSEHTSIIY